ncbi:MULTISPECIES: hypothetical protein [Chryseobacterium]|uniref:Uncharacterized protein n=1 Tax=Chryseobacterium camelliae TaxID=1265445 RepID=A0ABU0THB5_9FLAO|nr:MULTISPECIES: hypothetical protein [Chryseobacterium]MDT3405744.1 hypothetical protein [Pseudacidovorax intermedius]MDQ1096447.1 hypothetical protein [Chryseobacterium camelliae]MDQ1100388.1 hypothetical protein [Chryseobacterium sp. SORGH_AS_1048]MDR6087729.1 hypothetical protein [Chryseobacterium sp. SORGH_AS_0909]MDR6132105.1 hypothetical protein [Chryseobacterium sp. SORGH_AS_1175]
MYKKILAGLGGAIALNLLHETIRKNFNNVPEVNKVGEEALNKALDKADMKITNHDQLYAATLAGDVISNGIYYATTATSGFNIASGLLAGIGAVALPKKMGLDDTPVAETTEKKVMTVAYYLFGAVVTKLIYDKIK